MTDEKWIEKSVAVDSAKKFAEIERRLRSETIPEITSLHVKYGSFQSSRRVQACVAAVGDAVAEMIEVRLQAERDAHFRCGSREVSEARIERIRGDLERLHGERIEELLQQTVTGGESSFPGFYEVSAREVRERLEKTIELGVQRLQLDIEKPPPVPGVVGGSTFIQNVNAPNYGVLAQRIERVERGVAGGVGEALSELLEATRLLEEAQAAEAQVFVEGLVIEVERAERGEPTNRVGAAVLLERLKGCLEMVANAERVAALVTRVTDWLG